MDADHSDMDWHAKRCASVSKTRQREQVAVCATRRMVTEDEQERRHGETGTGVEVNGVARRRGLGTAMTRRGCGAPPSQAGGDIGIWIQRRAAGSGEAGCIGNDGGVYALEDDDGGAMGGERLREEPPRVQMAQVGLASGCARMLLENGGERMGGWQRAAKWAQQGGKCHHAGMEGLEGAICYGGEW